MMGSFLTRCIIMLLGYAYPAYECFKDVERKRPDVHRLRFWCQYWMIIAVITVVERVVDPLFSWVPMYCEVKLVFIIYLWYPRTKGTSYIYSTFLKPFLSSHKTEIDQNLGELRIRAGDMAYSYWRLSSVFILAKIFEFLRYVASQSSRPQETQRPSQHPQPTASATGSDALVHPSGYSRFQHPQPSPVPLKRYVAAHPPEYSTLWSSQHPQPAQPPLKGAFHPEFSVSHSGNSGASRNYSFSSSAPIYSDLDLPLLDYSAPGTGYTASDPLAGDTTTALRFYRPPHPGFYLKDMVQVEKIGYDP
ncbi:hypothetical protein O6H91_06G077600 [Diphasiastrum complanatum]|uniref:Uncharacterized protein n=1 Tax=Diphasiastrum complanatum TaxID=34168 RepID=A0ACC2DFI0_DIPCM|nr:hypothetical protein O6H91_06G077600 [Diphasiastrum complanatum]